MIKHVVILAGGSGTRLWPASKASRPKQFLDLGSGMSLFQETLVRAAALDPAGLIIVVTHASHVVEIKRQWQSLAESMGRPYAVPAARRVILPEPQARNTAPALIYAARILEELGERESTFIVLASDHDVGPISAFREDVEKADQLARADFLVSFGIPPKGPETGYGYLETGEQQGPGFRIETFHEKPDSETAQKYIAKENFFWNSGMFTYKVDVFMREMRHYLPDETARFCEHELKLEQEPSFLTPSDMQAVEAVYTQLSSISVDYALMEKSDRAAMVRATFEWSDVGSWDEVADRYSFEGADVLLANASGNFVFSDIPVALAGVEDLIVVIKNGVALICKKGSSQLVRDVVKDARQRGLQSLL